MYILEPYEQRNNRRKLHRNNWITQSSIFAITSHDEATSTTTKKKTKKSAPVRNTDFCVHFHQGMTREKTLLSKILKSWKHSDMKISNLFATSNPKQILTFVFFNTLFEIFIFCPIIQLWLSEKIVDFFWVKSSWKCCGFGLFSCWQLWFHEKNCQKNLSEKLGFGQNFDFSNSVCEVDCFVFSTTESIVWVVITGLISLSSTSRINEDVQSCRFVHLYSVL